MVESFDEYFVQEKTTVDKVLDVLVFFAVLVVTIFLILEIFGQAGKIDNITGLNNVYFYINIVVFIIFIADLIRLWTQSNDLKDFVKKNWLDVLATIPFGLMAQVATPTFEILKLSKFSKLSKLSKTAKLSKAAKVSKLSKEFKAASHLKKEGEDYNKKHRL